jgi:hypothetical protein
MSTVDSDDRSFRAVDRLMRERPLSSLDAGNERAAIERINRDKRDKLRARRGPVVFSTLD